jgi:hypothetical protein
MKNPHGAVKASWKFYFSKMTEKLRTLHSGRKPISSFIGHIEFKTRDSSGLLFRDQTQRG